VGITITTVNIRQRVTGRPNTDAWEAEHRRAKSQGQLVREPNAVAWFLDQLVARVAPALPDHIFSQGVADVPPGPGDLDAATCIALAQALEAATAADVLSSYAPIDGRDPEPGLEIAQSVAALARHAAGDGGLAIY
jgi:hypothetical protein